VVAVVLAVTSHTQTALLVAVLAIVYGGVEAVIAWRRRHTRS
jgi:Trk K+ transport system NAD-binding subunit